MTDIRYLLFDELVIHDVVDLVVDVIVVFRDMLSGYDLNGIIIIGASTLIDVEDPYGTP